MKNIVTVEINGEPKFDGIVRFNPLDWKEGLSAFTIMAFACAFAYF